MQQLASKQLTPQVVGSLLRGHLDSITSSGFAEGWAYDVACPLRGLTVAVIHEKNQVAVALAHLYREDLAEAGCGTGWCAFRARLTVPVSLAREMALSLVERDSGRVLQEARQLAFLEDAELPITSIDSLLQHDPTALGPIDRLRGCNDTLMTYIKKSGIENFVRAAYAYVLGRPADASGLATYTNMIRQSLLEPFDILRVLSDCDEFRARVRSLGAPGTPGFPFQL